MTTNLSAEPLVGLKPTFIPPGYAYPVLSAEPLVGLKLL